MTTIVTYRLILTIAIGVTFGIWKNSINAGLFAGNVASLSIHLGG